MTIDGHECTSCGSRSLLSIGPQHPLKSYSHTYVCRACGIKLTPVPRHEKLARLRREKAGLGVVLGSAETQEGAP